MTWFVIDAFILMFVCFALGSLIAWLAAVAIYPKVDEAFTDLDLEESR